MYIRSYRNKKTKFMSTLNPYTGTWQKEQAKFLLGRTTFGKTRSEIDESIALGLEGTLDKLLQHKELDIQPIYHKFENDPDVPIGQTWVHTYHPENDVQGLRNSRRRSVAIWFTGLMQESHFNIMGKMLLFWHEHLPVNDVNYGEVSYKYFKTFHSHYLGNFQRLIEEITIDPAMLRFLNGNTNTKESPNENYSRELLELFSIGRGDAAGTGDYTNYTEQDVVEMARSLTGWVARINPDTNEAYGKYISPRHDNGTKGLSHRFDNTIIINKGEEEYKEIIQIIFNKKEVARFICRKLHIWFVGSDISDDVETNIIDPMADILIENGYVIEPALRALLASEYFISGQHMGCMISSPIDYLFKVINTFEIYFPDDQVSKSFLWESIASAAGGMEMAILGVPSVAGWKAYYQEPSYYRYWINSVTLATRDLINKALVIGIPNGSYVLGINALEFVSKIENANDPNVLIDEVASIIFETSISDSQRDYLKSVLIPGLPDFEWTVEYGEYLGDPDDPQKKTAIDTKLKQLFAAMLAMPEFYIM